jgi:hypothetical protein
MKMTANIQQFLHCEKRGSLTNLYLELGLPLRTALQTAEADLRQFDVSQGPAELETVIKASRAVPGEILLQELIQTLSKIELASSGKL